MSANFTYTIFSGRLVGLADGRVFNINALAGGRGGKLGKRQPATEGVTNNPYRTGLRTRYGRHHVHGGPLPAGRYRIERPQSKPHLGLCARLLPVGASAAMRSGNFYIHQRGPHGSDGCIVPTEKFQELMDALDAEGKQADEKENISARHIVGTLFVQDDEVFGIG